ncbi:MAG: oleate hydratase [Candidatus Electrothrix sp. YB6]
MENSTENRTTENGSGKAYIVGSGAAALASAAYLIRNAGFTAENIHILTDRDVIADAFKRGPMEGGSLGAGTEPEGFVSPGGRMFEKHYECMFDLLKSIPSVEAPELSVAEDIFEFNEKVVSDAKCRLLKNGKKIDVSSYGLSLRDQLDMLHLVLDGKGKVDEKIEDWFSKEFFKTNFWYLWTTSFSMLPQDNVDELRRYFLRFIHLLPGFNRYLGILRTKYNQYDSLIRPMVSWLQSHNVNFDVGAKVTDIEFEENEGKRTATAIVYHCGEREERIEHRVENPGYVFATLGSMVDNTTIGSTTKPAPAPPKEPGTSWQLWRNIAKGRPEFGNPEVFLDRRSETTWPSFTVTLDNPKFFDYMEKFTGNKAGTGGLVSFTDSNWGMSIVLFHQPFYIGQDESQFIFWGDGLSPFDKGNRVKKPMVECTGREMLEEVAHHLKLTDAQYADMFGGAVSIPALMPYITSQFQTRKPGDRPAVIPEGATNFAFMGQFCEIEDDVVFTVEYSFRAAAMAVYGLLNKDDDWDWKVPAMYEGEDNPIVDFKALLAILR